MTKKMVKDITDFLLTPNCGIKIKNFGNEYVGGDLLIRVSSFTFERADLDDGVFYIRYAHLITLRNSYDSNRENYTVYGLVEIQITPLKQKIKLQLDNTIFGLFGSKSMEFNYNQITKAL